MYGSKHMEATLCNSPYGLLKSCGSRTTNGAGECPESCAASFVALLVDPDLHLWKIPSGPYVPYWSDTLYCLHRRFKKLRGISPVDSYCVRPNHLRSLVETRESGQHEPKKASILAIKVGSNVAERETKFGWQ